MNVNLIVSATAVLVGLMVGLVFYLQSQSDDASYLIRSKWSVTTADGVAQTWLIDSESGAIRITSTFPGSTIVDEIFGGKKYTYSAPALEPFDADAFCADIDDYDGDCAVLASVQEETIADMQKAWSTDKAECSSEDFGVSSGTTSLKSDGNLSMSGFTISMVNGSPTTILDGAGGTFGTINSFENVEGQINISGCSGDEDIFENEDLRRATLLQGVANIAESRRKLGEVDAEVEKARNFLSPALQELMHPDDRDETSRHLGFSGWMSNTNWCGAGTTLRGRGSDGQPCPDPSWVNSSKWIGHYDYQADVACRRHDHATYVKSLWWGPSRLGCQHDLELHQATANNVITGTYAEYGVSLLWGCRDDGRHWCIHWHKKWWGGYPGTGNHCFGGHTRRGQYRYRDIQHNYGYYIAPMKCDGDLPMLPQVEIPPYAGPSGGGGRGCTEPDMGSKGKKAVLQRAPVSQYC